MIKGDIVTDIKVLRQKSEDTSRRKCKSLKIFERLEQALDNSSIPGVGLSAIQIGVPIKANIIRIKGNKARKELILNMYNPVITKLYDEIVFPNEACLSLPGRSEHTKRYRYVHLTYYNQKGELREGAFSGFEAVVVQHEVDHNDGVLFLDKIAKVGQAKSLKTGRNQLCPCGSGKKYKKCCEGREE